MDNLQFHGAEDPEYATKHLLFSFIQFPSLQFNHFRFRNFLKFVVMLNVVSFSQPADFRMLQRIDECGEAWHEVCAFVVEEEMCHVAALQFQVHRFKLCLQRRLERCKISYLGM